MSPRQRGFTLIELSLSLVALGLLAAVMLQFLGRRVELETVAVDNDLLSRADHAVSGFLLAHWRLPCPDDDSDGYEDCARGAQTGQLPYVTVGLPDARAGQLRYGVLRRPGTTPRESTDLAVAGDRFYPLIAEGGPPMALALPRGNINGLDLCHSLRTAAGLITASASDLNYLHTVGPSGTRSVAYAIAAGGLDANGDGNRFDGASTGATSIGAPTDLRVSGDDDRRIAVGPEQLWSRLGCGAALSGPGHTQPNAASAAAVLAHALNNYVQVLRLEERMAIAGVASAAASVAGAVAAIADAATATALALAQAFITLGATSAIVAAAAVSVAAAAASMVTAALTTALSATALALAVDVRERGEALAATAVTLATTLRSNTLAADAVGTY